MTNNPPQTGWRSTAMHWLRKFGHLQARCMLLILYFLIMTPYGLLIVRRQGRKATPCWKEISEHATLAELRRPF